MRLTRDTKFLKPSRGFDQPQTISQCPHKHCIYACWCVRRFIMKHATVSLETNGLELLNWAEYRSSTPMQECSPTLPDSFVVVSANRRTTNGGIQLQDPFSSPPLNTSIDFSRSHDIPSPHSTGTADYRPGRARVTLMDKEKPPPPEDYFTSRHSGSSGSVEGDGGSFPSSVPGRETSPMRRMKGLGEKVSSR